MSKVISFLVILFLSTAINAQKISEKKNIENTIETFFDGLHKGDSAIVASTLHSSIKIQTTFTTKNDVKTLANQSKKQLLTGIANKKPEHIYFEKLLSWNIHIDGNLASVWTPYEFYFNNKFSHCGANSFQLFNNNGKWEIIFLVDMRRTKKCINTKK